MAIPRSDRHILFQPKSQLLTPVVTVGARDLGFEPMDCRHSRASRDSRCIERSSSRIRKPTRVPI